MKVDKMSNIVVLKGISSNVVEEAIVVLKPNITLKSSKIKTTSEHNKTNTILKEAEHVVNSYIHKMQDESNKIEKQTIKKKYQYLKTFTVLLILTNIFFMFKNF